MSSEVLSLWRGKAEDASASGREAELSMLLRELDDAKASQKARFVFVKGPQGVGKSHLFGLLRTAAARKSAPVFEGGSGRDARRTFGLFAPIVQELLSHLGQDGVPAARLAELARLVGPLTKATSAQVMENRRVELYDAVCELFALAARSSPVFLLPDLEVADRASLELLRYVAAVATTPGAKAGGLFVGALRDEGTLPSPLPEVLAKVPSRSLPLAGLDVEGIRAYLSRGDVAQRLLEATGGNPEALERLLDRPGPSLDLFVKRAERLEPAARAVLDALSICADAQGLGTLQQAVRSAEVAPELDALVQGRYLAARVVDGQPVYRFSREADRRAWAEAMPGARRAEVQREVAQALAASGDVISAAGLLFELGPSPEAVALSVRAGDELSARGAHEDAAALYARALTVLTGGERARVLDRMAQVLAGQGAWARAARALLESNRLSGSAPKVLLAARHLVRAGRTRRVEALLPRLLQTVETRFEAEAVRAELQLVRGNTGRALELCQGALQAGENLAPAAAIGLRNIMGRALLARNETREAAELFALNASVADEAGLKDLGALARLNRGVAAQKLGERDAAIAHYRSAESHAVARHAALANLGALYYDAGDFELALDCQSRALQLVARHIGPKETAHVAVNLARLHHFLGDFERAAELSEHALALA
ncbi:MAG: AAA family ATPase [Archangiaceae bacterium]|nr:AAA family ATPase [Archangiaceae bacterium]